MEQRQEQQQGATRHCGDIKAIVESPDLEPSVPYAVTYLQNGLMNVTKAQALNRLGVPTALGMMTSEARKRTEAMNADVIEFPNREVINLTGLEEVA